MVLNIISFHLLCSLASAQRSSTMFGPMTDTPLGYTPLGLNTLRMGSHRQAEMIILASANPALRCYAVDSAGTISHTASLTLTHPAQQFITGDLDGNGIDEVVAFSSQGSTITILWKAAANWEETSIPVSSEPQEIIIGDLNNDKHKDLILFGKSSAGVSVLYGRGAKRFKGAVMVFEDISVSDLKTTDLNGDGITDVVLLNWLSEELMVFYGIGRGIFAEQVSVKLSGEPARVAIGTVSKRRTILAAVSIPSRREILVLHGNSTGEFIIQEIIATPPLVNSLTITDGNNDGISDIAFCSSDIIGISPGTPNSFGIPIPFGTGLSIAGWAIADVNRDKQPDLISIDRATQRLAIVGGSNSKAPLRWPNQYCVGSMPVGLSTGDFTGDGRVDIAVANSGSAAVSLLINKGGGIFDGQIPLLVGEQPSFVGRPNDNGKMARTLVISHPASDRVTVCRIDSAVNRSRSISLRTATNPYVVFARENPEISAFEMVVRYKEIKNGSLAMSLFEQMSDGKFIEKNLTANFPNRVLALTVDNLTGDGHYELVFASREKDSPRTTIELGIADPKFNFRTVKRLFSYSDSTSSTHSLFSGYMNSDSLKDILVLLGPPRKALGISYALSAGVFSDSVEWVPGVLPLNDDVVLLQDVNGDDRNDITYLDGDKERVFVIYQRVEGGFRIPMNVMDASGVRGIRIAQLKVPGVNDLVLSHADKGKVSIVFDAFRR